MKKFIPILLAVMVISCSKTHAPVIPDFVVSPYKIATATGGPSTLRIYTAKYAGNLITALVSSDDSISILYNSAGRPLSKIRYANSIVFPTNKQEFDYDGNGNIISDRLYSGAGGFYALYETAVFHYSANKLSEMIVRDDTGAQSFRFAYTWTGADITLIKEYDTLDHYSCTDTLSYDLSHTNNIAVDFPDYHILDPSYEPGLYEELFCQHPLTRMAHSCTGVVDNSNYTYDASGRIRNIDNGPTYAGYLFTYTN